MTKKLLHKTTQNFLMLAIVILLVSAPVFYFASHYLYQYEADEVLIFHKENFVKESQQKNFSEADIALWNRYTANVNVIADTGLRKDSLFSTEYFDEVSKENEPFRELWAPVTINGKRFTYTEKSNLVVMEEMALAVAIMFLSVIAILMIAIIWFSKRSSSRLWSPFYDTLQQMQGFELDKNNRPEFTATDIEEFSQLNNNLERLIDKNVAIFKNQREFIENAAHELQTPLALFQAKIDSMFQLKNSDEQSVLLNHLNDDVSRLNRLNKNLLLLSKIDSEQYFEKQPIVLNDAIKKHLDFFTEQAQAKNISILTEFTQTVKIDSNMALVEIMVNNLFLNAIRHNKPHGKIIITMANDSLTFLNTGSEEALNSEKIFQRFAKLNPSGRGNGLGLAIIKRAVEINNWSIAYSFYNNLHGFTVKFK